MNKNISNSNLLVTKYDLTIERNSSVHSKCTMNQCSTILRYSDVRYICIKAIIKVKRYKNIVDANHVLKMKSYKFYHRK